MSARPKDAVLYGARLSEPRVRPMQPGDLREVTAIENRVYDFPWSRNVFMSCFSAGCEASVLELGGRIVSYGITMVATAECHLVNLSVDYAFQRRGFGRKLLRLMLDRAAACGARRVILEVRASNLAARALYNSEHFSQISLRKNYYPTEIGCEDALVLAKLL